MNKSVANSFAKNFLSRPLARQIDACERNELAPLFLELFRDHQPVMEAGCGSGRWVAWFAKKGVQSDGVDWSTELCDRASEQIPDCSFFACDMCSIPVPDQSYGGIIALGSIEHSSEGPIGALREFYRLLRNNGIAVITVPNGGVLRRIMRLLSAPILRLKANVFVRRLFGKSTQGASLKEARMETVKTWHPRFSFGEQGWHFYQYEFNKAQMRTFLSETGFHIQQEFVGFGNQGILHNFGRLSGKWNRLRADVDFTLIGWILRAVIPVSWMGHMLCYVVVKRSSNKQVETTH